MLLSNQQIENYQNHGYLTGLEISDSEEVKTFRKEFDELEVKEGIEKCQIGLVDYHLKHQFIWKIANHPKILDCIEQLIGPDILLLATHFFCKYGPNDKFVAWHQDVTYWGLNPPLAVTAWYAIDDSDIANGCMQVIPRTHKSGLVTHGKSNRSGNLLSINQEIEVDNTKSAASVNLILKAGQISIHHGHLIHGSLANQSNRRRCGLTLRYVPPFVQQTEENSMAKKWQGILLRGQDNHQNFPNIIHPFI